jgi:hypothetical protein
LISKSHKTNDEENQALVAHVKKRKERRNSVQRRLEDQTTRRMYQKLYVTIARSWDIMPFNVLMGKERENIKLM